jgi:hypothetical protein
MRFPRLAIHHSLLGGDGNDLIVEATGRLSGRRPLLAL